jgi:RHS repeat-associated protein
MFNNKYISILAAILLLPILGYGQSGNYNYIRIRSPRTVITGNTVLDSYTNIKDSVSVTYEYIDGLGRPMQTVQQQGSPGGNDIIQPYQYDTQGRDSVSFLPYTIASSAPGSYRPNAVETGTGYHSSEQYQFFQTTGQSYKTTPYPYTKTNYEPSDVNRVSEKGAPGLSWQVTTDNVTGGGHTAKIDYVSNDQSVFNGTSTSNNPGSRMVALYTVTINSDQSRVLVRAGNTATYGTGTLTVKISKNENWNATGTTDGCLNTVEEYTDLEGHVVLKRTYNQVGSAVQMLSTYYVYDDMGNLAFVLTPGANPDNNAAISQTTLNNLCYQYRYDDRNRLTQKKLPGKGWEFIYYNSIDKLVGSQDANQRAQTPQTGSFVKYDAQGRVVMTGILTYTGSTADTNRNAPSQTVRTSIQNAINATATLWETPLSTATTGYNSLSYPTSGYTPLTINYYDNYTNVPSLPSNYIPVTAYSKQTMGLLTASKTAVLTSPGDMLWTVSYYDDLGRNINLFRQHYLNGHSGFSLNNYDATSLTYNFTNAVTQSVRNHYTTTHAALVVGNSYIYDHLGRKTKTGEQIFIGSSPGTPVYLSFQEYNELGQLKAKHYNSTDGVNYLGEMAYSYNERGWISALTPIGLSNYAETISYDQPATGGTAQYNGNISQLTYNSPYMNVFYQQAQTSNNVVNYSYDKLNRLKSAISSYGVSDESATYDQMGNIVTLTRTSGTSLTSIVTNNYGYSYMNGNGNSNQLMGVTLNSGTFRTYAYDQNGNATSDGGSKTISYNLLNLPQNVTTGSTTLAKYTYAADGNKLRDSSSTNGVWDYDNGIVYLNGNVSFIQTEEGKASLVSPNTQFTYTYDLKDYLGNVRASFDNQGTGGTVRIVQENNYYAFGLSQLYYDNSNGNRYLYNKKEQQLDLTNQYDYGARFYDPVIARWTSVDPKAEQYRRWSAYNYGVDNPIRFIDPDGMGVENGNQDPVHKDVVASTSNSEITQTHDVENVFSSVTLQMAGVYNDITSVTEWATTKTIYSVTDTKTGIVIGLETKTTVVVTTVNLDASQSNGFSSGSQITFSGTVKTPIIMDKKKGPHLGKPVETHNKPTFKNLPKNAKISSNLTSAVKDATQANVEGAGSNLKGAYDKVRDISK